MTYQTERRQIMTALPTYFEHAFVAGGAVTSVFTGAKINDVDLYFKSQRDFGIGVYQAYEDGLWCVAASKRAVTFADGGGNIAQLMHFDFFPSAGDIFKAFDFTVVMGALDLDLSRAKPSGLPFIVEDTDTPDSGFILHDDFLKHNSQRFLRFNPGTRYPLASACRVLKYQQRGYTIGKGDMMKIALAVRGVRIESWEDLKDQIGGAYGDKVVLENEHLPFSLEAAIDALTVDKPEDEIWAKPDNDNMPGTAEGLLRKVAELKGEEYVPVPLGEDGWPLPAEALPLAA